MTDRPQESQGHRLHQLAAAALAVLAREGHPEFGANGTVWRATLSAKSGLSFDISCAGPDLPAAVEPSIASAAQIAEERTWIGTYRLVVRASRLIVFDLSWTVGEPMRIMGFSRGDWESDLVALTPNRQAQRSQAHRETPMANEAATAVLAADSERLHALTEADYDALALLLSDRLVHTHGSGKVESKAAYLEPLRAGQVRYRHAERIEAAAEVNGDTAWLYGRLKMQMTRDGGTVQVDNRILSVWVHEAGGWKMAAFSSTPIRG